MCGIEKENLRFPSARPGLPGLLPLLAAIAALTVSCGDAETGSADLEPPSDAGEEGAETPAGAESKSPAGEDPGAVEPEERIPQEWHDAPASLRDSYRIVTSAVELDRDRRFPRRIEHVELGVEFLYVRSGTFYLGSPEGEEGRYEDEEPLVHVGINGFYVSRTEIPYTAWRAGGGREVLGVEATHPVTGVTWFEARDWCATNELTLPSEAQWEYTASGGLDDVFPWGASPERRRSNAQGTNSRDPWPETSPVGAMSTDCSWCGVLDLAGNVMEWCQDAWEGDYSWVEHRAIDPVRTLPPEAGEAPEVERVVRGGSYYSDTADQLRTAYRNSILPTDMGGNLGFRAVIPF